MSAPWIWLAMVAGYALIGPNVRSWSLKPWISVAG